MKDPAWPGEVAAVVTHDNLPGLQSSLKALVPQAERDRMRVVVAADAPRESTRVWLAENRDRFDVLVSDKSRGPGGARNLVFRAYPNARSYFFFDDDQVLEGREVKGLSEGLALDPGIGIVSALPCYLDGTPIARSFTRRPLGAAVPRLWDRWWGVRPTSFGDRWLEADIVGSSSIAVRGQAQRTVGEFDPMFWPGCHEDVDFAARIRFSGYRIFVDSSLRVRQSPSTTFSKVFGPRHAVVCRATSVLFAALDYPTPIAIGRVMQACGQSLLGGPGDREGDASGLLRCARDWMRVARGRWHRRSMRVRIRTPDG